MPSPGINNVGSVTEKALKKQDQQQLEKLLDKPDDRDAEDFNAQMEAGLKSENETSIEGSPVELKQAPDNLGDRILNAFQGMKENIDSRHQKIDNMLSSDETLSMRDMFKTQKAMTNLMMTEDLIGKVVGKATQTIETLAKQQ
ncbi:type III secretion system inner rod subunit SctI [Sansalvadorimonas verongulae]|uniref:type III secretion system inner rod subunit SctI n=1 Tax=Sansalvadorimonas verongulae TaxID=2172824 RepID=UPI0012BB6265|nr:type III secretion system inner rod subunit SctI [Sansalvadorimonas verongulae]MTI14155.1 EscI/YscI/HrpB family type III secretion system inner rod protein [Sansalvadorimonas verongulae]